jgi:hypothetical protein
MINVRQRPRPALNRRSFALVLLFLSTALVATACLSQTVTNQTHNSSLILAQLAESKRDLSNELVSDENDT